MIEMANILDFRWSSFCVEKQPSEVRKSDRRTVLRECRSRSSSSSCPNTGTRRSSSSHLGSGQGGSPRKICSVCRFPDFWRLEQLHDLTRKKWEIEIKINIWWQIWRDLAKTNKMCVFVAATPPRTNLVWTSNLLFLQKLSKHWRTFY